MEIIALPDVLLDAEANGHSDVIFYHHVGHRQRYKSKISFSKHCLTFLLSGTKQIFVEEKNVVYDNSSCLLFRSGNYLSQEMSGGGQPYHSILIFFSERALREVWQKHHDVVMASEQHDDWSGEMSVPTDDYIEAFKASAKKALTGERPFSPALQAIKFEEVMLYLVEKHGASIVDFFQVAIDEDSLRLVRRVVEANVHNDVSIDELAFLCHMSKSTFKRKFVELYDDSPGRWLRNRRLDCAAELLIVHRRRPSDIYGAVGFSSLSSFTYSFRSKFGTTPKQYQLDRDGSSSH